MSEDLAEKKGWRYESLVSNMYRIYVPESAHNPQPDALPIAASIMLKHGFGYFIFMEDKDFPNSGTSFDRGRSYGGGPGIFIYTIGSSFLIMGYKEYIPEKQPLEVRKILADYSREQKEAAKKSGNK